MPWNPTKNTLRLSEKKQNFSKKTFYGGNGTECNGDLQLVVWRQIYSVSKNVFFHQYFFKYPWNTIILRYFYLSPPTTKTQKKCQKWKKFILHETSHNTLKTYSTMFCTIFFEKTFFYKKVSKFKNFQKCLKHHHFGGFWKTSQNNPNFRENEKKRSNDPILPDSEKVPKTVPFCAILKTCENDPI